MKSRPVFSIMKPMGNSEEIRLEWEENMRFRAKTLTGGEIYVDSDYMGDVPLGPKPMDLLLISLASCTGMDVVSILKKMKVPFKSFIVKVRGYRREKHPRVYERIEIEYIFNGNGLNVKAIEKAINLSLNKYCPVTAMLRKTAEIIHSYRVISEEEKEASYARKTDF